MTQRASAPNARELQRYLGRIGDRWPLRLVMLGGTRIADMRPTPEAGARREGPEHIVVLVSDGFDGMPWLERVHQASSLWDTLEMGGPAEVHCYTPAEYLRRRETTPAVRSAAESGVLLYADTEPFTAAAEYLRRRETTPVVREVAEHGLLVYADSAPFTVAPR